jgi:hypothetical protein
LSILVFREKRKTRHRYLVTEQESLKGRRFVGRGTAKIINLPVPLCPTEQVLGIAADADMMNALQGG